MEVDPEVHRAKLERNELVFVFLMFFTICIAGIASLVYQCKRLGRALQSNEEKVRKSRQEYAATAHSLTQERRSKTRTTHAELVNDIHAMAQMQTQVTQQLMALKQVVTALNDAEEETPPTGVEDHPNNCKTDNRVKRRITSDDKKLK